MKGPTHAESSHEFFGCTLDRPFQSLSTDLDLHDRLLYAIEHEDEQDGAEGAPLAFNLSELKGELDECFPAPCAHLLGVTPASSALTTRPLAPSAASPADTPLPTCNVHPSTAQTSPIPKSSSPPSFPSLPPLFSGEFSPTASSYHNPRLTHSLASITSAECVSFSDPIGASKQPSTSPSNPPLHCGPLPGRIQKAVPPFSKPHTKKLQSKLRSLKKRKERAISSSHGRMPDFYRKPRLSTARHVPQPQTLTSNVDSTSLPVARHCWVGRNLVPSRSTPWSREELVAKGYKLVPWDGWTPKVITDDAGRAIVIFVGGPTRDPTGDHAWSDVARRAATTMASVRKEGIAADLLPKDAQSHRRGEFVALPVGVSHGNGRLKPGNLYHPPERRKLVERLLGDQDIQRITSYQSSVFSYYAPKLYAQYCHNLVRVFDHDETLQRNFKDSIFPAASFNLGPATVSIDHTDAGNVGYGLCALASLGSFDSRRGGHLILFDMGLFVEFPPGTIALLPSGILRHGNTPIQDGEERYSIAQYCAGGLLRWVKYGCQTAVSIRQSFSKAKAEEVLGSLNGVHEDRVQEALHMFSKVDELASDRRETYKDFATFLKED